MIAEKDLTDRYGMEIIEPDKPFIAKLKQGCEPAYHYVNRAFTQKYPQIKLRIVQYQKYKDFSEMNCDIMIHSTEYPVQKENLLIIYREPILLAVSVCHPFASRNSRGNHAQRREFWSRFPPFGLSEDY